MRKFAIAAGFLALLAALVIYISWDRTYTVVIPEATLQEEASQRFPIKKDYLFFFSIKLYDPHIALDPQDGSIRLGLSVRNTFKINDHHIDSSLTARGQLEYQASTGAFYLRDFSLEDFDLGGIPEKHQDAFKKLTTEALNTYFRKQPVYRLKDTDVKQLTARLVLKSVTVKNKELHITLGLNK